MSKTILNITPTTMISNQYIDVILNSNERTSMNTINVNDDRSNQRDREKGERENRDDDVKRTRQINENTHSVTSNTNEQYNSSINTNSMTNYISSYPSLNRYYTTPSRPRYYSDNFNFDIINEEIIEIIYLNHYPTLIERWGDDTKTIIQQQGEYQIEEYVEFDEIEPTIIEEISYEYIYSGDQIQSTKEIHHSRSESRNFRKIRKRRTKRKRPTQSIHPSSYSTQNSHNDLINEKISLQNFKSDEKEEVKLFNEKKHEYENTIQEDINQYHVTSNDIISRRESSINETNRKQTKPQPTVLEVNQNDTTNKSFIQSTDTKDKLESSSLDDDSFRTTHQNLDSFLKSLSSHLTLDSFDEDKIIDQQQNSQSKTKFEDQISSESLTELVHQIPAIPLTSTPVETNKQIEINSFISIKNKKQSDLDNLSTTTDYEETTVPSNSPVILINIPSPSTEIKTETGYTADETDEKSIINLIDETDKQPETIFIQPRRPEEKLSQQTDDNKNETIIINYVNETAETSIADEQQSLILLKIKEDENVECPSDFLVDIVRQITTTSSINDLSSVNHAEQPTKNPSIEIIEQNNMTSTSTVVPEQTEIIPLLTGINETTLPITDINVQASSKSSLPDNLLNELGIVPSPIVSESSYSISELTNSIPTKTLSEGLSNIPQQSEILTSSETDYNSLYQHRYFPFTTVEQTLAHFAPTDNEQLEEKSSPSDLTKMYYELQEQRHIQPVFHEIPTKEKQETLDINLNNHLDMNSFSFISNLPSQEYRQVFGVPDEIVNTVDDLTNKVDQVLRSSIPNEKSQIIETPADHQSIISTDQGESIHQTASSITSNPELDFRYTSLLDRISTLIKPLLDLPSDSSTTENEIIPSNLIDVISNNSMDLPTVTESEVILSKSSEEQEVDEHQQLPSTGLFETVKNLFSSTTSTETNVETQQQEDTTGKLVDNNESSNIITKLSSVLNDALSTVQNVLPTSTTSDIDTNQQTEIPNTSVESSINNQEEHHGVFDLVVNAITDVKETILNLGSSNEQTSSNISDKSINDIRLPEVFDNDKEQQETVEETINNTKEKSVPIEEQSIKISKPPVNSNYPWYSSQYKVADTEHDRLSAAHSSSSIDHKQHDEMQTKPPSQQLQVINDDYAWYSSHFTILDAEARFARLSQQIPSITKQEDIINSSNTTDAVSSMTNIVPISESIQEDSLSNESVVSHTKDQPSIVTNDTINSSTRSEVSETQEVDHKQSSSSIGLLETMKNIVPSTFLSNTSTDMNSESAQPIIQLQQPKHTNEDQQTGVSETTQQSSTTNNENHGILDFLAETASNVKETISNLISRDEQVTTLTSLPSSSDKSPDDIEQSEDLDNDKDEKTVSVQKPVGQSPERLVNSGYPWYSSQYKVADSEHDRLSTTHQSLAISPKEQDNTEKKPSDQQLQIISDDYPWYTSHFTIVDAEARFARLYKQISTINKHDDITNVVSSVTNVLPIPESIAEDFLSTKSSIDHSKDQSSIVTNDTITSSTPLKEIPTKEIDYQQQSLSSGLLEMMKNLLPSQILSHTPTETNSESTQLVVEDEQTGVSKTTLQPSDEKEHSVFDFVAETISNVKETISNLVSHDGKTAASESPSKISNKLNDESQELEHLNNDKNQQTEVELIEEKVVQSPKHSIVSNYSPHLNQHQVATTEYDLLPTTDESSTFNPKEQDNIEKKLSSQQLQVIHDDYPWYTSHFTIPDAEAKLAQLNKQLNLSNEQSLPPTVIEVSTKLNTEQDDDTDGFRVVQRRTRIPSSTIHEKTISSTMVTPKSMLSSDIDLEPVILHGHPDVSVPISAIIPQTTGTTNKKKHKKKKKGKQEIILFDAPEPTSFNINEQKIDSTQQYQENIDINDSVFSDHTFNHELEQLHSIPTTSVDDQKSDTLPTAIISNTEELNQIDETTNESTPSNISQLLSTPIIVLPQDDKVNAQTIEQQSTDKESTPQSPPSITKTIHNKANALSKEKEKEDDDEGFQVVHYRKRILSTPKSDRTQSPTPNLKEPSSSDTDQKTIAILEHQNPPTLMTTNTQSSPSKKKKNKHKKQKKEIDSSSTIDSIKTTQEPIDQKTSSQSHIPSSSVIKDTIAPPSSTLPPVINPTSLRTKPSVPKEAEEEEEDNEGFQVVTYRKRITSSSSSVNTPSSAAAKTRYEQNYHRNIAHRSVVLHGRHGSAFPSVSRTTNSTKTRSNQKKEVRSKQDQKETSSFNTTSRSASAEMHNITSTDADNDFWTSKIIKQKTEQPQPIFNEHQQKLKDSEHEPILNAKLKLDQSSLEKQSTEKIVKEHPTSTKIEIEDTVSSTAMSTNNTNPEKSELIKDDNGQGQVAHSHQSIPSSTIVPEIITPQTTTSKKKSKKSKITKNDIHPPLTTGFDSIPLSVEETIDQKANNVFQLTSANNSSNADETTLINTTYETITSEITEPADQTDDTAISLHSVKSAASTTTAVEEISILSNEQPGEVHDFSIAQPVRSASISQGPSTDIPSTTNQMQNEIITKEIVPTTSIEPTTNTEDEHIKTTLSKKPAKRRKKKSHPKEIPDDDHTLTSSTNTVATEPIAQQITDVNQQSNSNTIPKTNPIETTTNPSFYSLTNNSTTLSNEMNNKLDLFLPEYIRQQINTHEIHSSTPISSDTIHKKKPRHKMLKKDHEAKSLLTNEFDTEKQSTQHINSTNNDNTNLNHMASEPTIDNILSRGFYLWLQESQAISQKKDNLTNIMQSIVIQPVTTHDDDEDEDSWNASKVNRSTYTTGVRPEKRIHTTNAYFINHPQSISTPSWLIAQSNDDTFQDHPDKFNSDNEEDSTNNDTSKPQLNGTTNNVQQNLSKDYYHQLNTNPSINFDDWAHFLEEKNSYHIGDDLSTSLECFYTEIYDEDTLLSDAIPIHHPIKNERQRYGDFSSSNNDECIIKRPLYKSKPSEYFQNWRKEELISLSYQDDDDEILISHSNDGLSRRVRL